MCILTPVLKYVFHRGEGWTVWGLCGKVLPVLGCRGGPCEEISVCPVLDMTSSSHLQTAPCRAQLDFSAKVVAPLQKPI